MMKLCLRSAAIVLMILQAGCASRPDAGVLRPTPAIVSEHGAERVQIIAATNRQVDAERAGYNSDWTPSTSFEIFDLSVPAERDGVAISYPGKTVDPRRQYVVQSRTKVTKEAVVKELMRSAQFDGSSGIFVHGYNYSYQEALYRTAQVAADARIKNAPVLFSWPSTASVTGYLADREAAMSSRTALTDLVKTLAEVPGMKQVVLFGHSMGGFLVMETVRQLKLEGRRDVLEKLAVILAAPDIDVDVFRSQLQDIGPAVKPITLLVARSDRALSVSSMLARERPRVGQLSMKDASLKSMNARGNFRIIDITSLDASDGLGHDRYTALAKFGTAFLSAESSPLSDAGQIGFVFDPAAASSISAPPDQRPEQTIQ